MSPTEPSVINDLEKLSDEQLVQFINKSRQPNGSILLELDGWDELPPEQLSRLRARLQAVEQRIPSCPLDVDDLTARLLQAADDREARASAAPEPNNDQSVTEMPDPDLSAIEETIAHDKLVKAGGRPLYPIAALRQVLENPDEHLDMLRPFWRHPETWHDHTTIFKYQWLRWSEFRYWQLDNRRIEEDASAEYAVFVEEQRAHYKRIEYADGLAKLDSDPTYLSDSWARHLEKRNWQRRICRERGCRSLRDYEAAAKVRLHRHGFDQPFRLHRKPGRQSALTTWIEYLCFECWWQDWYADRLTYLTPGQEVAWRNLCDEGVLQPDETAEFLGTPDSVMRLSREKHDTDAALLAANLEVERLSEPETRSANGQSTVGQADGQRKKEALRQQALAKTKHESAGYRAWKIGEFLGRSRDYRKAQRNVQGQLIVLEWVKGQASMMLRSSKPQGRARKRPAEEDARRTRPAKKQATSSEGPPRSSGDGDGEDAERTSAARPNTAKPYDAHVTRSTRRRSTRLAPPAPLDSAPGAAPVLRRSARIKARQEAATAAEAGSGPREVAQSSTRKRRPG